jgi:hypothetical protein
MSNERVHEALAPSTFPGFESFTASKHSIPHSTHAPQSASDASVWSDVTHHLDELAQDIVATPGAGGALLVAFAAQARALTLVIEAARRTQDGAAALPAEVLGAVQAALRMPTTADGLGLAWQF